MFHRDTCHREFHQRNSRDKCLLREACFDGGDVTVKKNSVTLNEERGGRWEDRKFNAAWCFSGAHATVRFTKETFVTSSCRVKRVFTWALSRWRDTVTLNEDKDEDSLVEEGPQIERGTVTHATVRFITETSVTSGSCVKRVLTWAMSKWR